MADATLRTTIAADQEVTTGHQSHRNLRLSLAGIVLALFVAVGTQVALSGGVFLPSISHYFYTPAHNLFVAALAAASLALVALAGRDLETVFLDIAAVFAPLIGLVPTGITAALLGSITGKSVETTAAPCDADKNCVPEQYLGAVYNGVVTYSVILLLVVILSIVLRRKTIWTKGKHRAWRRFTALTAPIVALVVLVVLNLVAFAPPINTNFPFNPWPLHLSVHFTATILFFGMFTIVPIINAVRSLGIVFGRIVKEDDENIKVWHAVVYASIPVWMLVDIGVLIGIVHAESAAPTSGPGVLVCEAIALALFAVFWVVQTIQRWPERSQRSII